MVRSAAVIFALTLLCSAGRLSAQTAAAAPLTIERAVELAVARNERAAAAETIVEAAEARLGRARSAFFPQVDVTGSYRSDTATETRNTLSSAALLTQPIFDARVFPLLRFARLERSAARLSADEEKRLLAFDAADAFLITLSLEQVLRAAEHRREFARTSLEDARSLFEAGLVSSNDVTRAELEMATAERGVAQASGNVRSARIQLSTILNTEIDGALQVPESLLAAAASTPDVAPSLVTEAQQRRRDIAAARFRVDALRAFAGEPSRRFIPSVRLSAQTRNINEGPISDRNNDAFVGVTVNWPVLDAGVRKSEEAERTAIARGAELGLQLALRNVEQQMRTAGVQLSSEQAALREAVAAVRAARRNAEETNELYRQGLASALELANANQSLFEAEVAEVTARYRMAQAYLALREAAGLEPAP
ncbi:MAG TPA: TolC family protein [Thermoanaerobaculia bacterium]|nr:TolC family protein [Thermoanaerobaculia bacterium]